MSDRISKILQHCSSANDIDLVSNEKKFRYAVFDCNPMPPETVAKHGTLADGHIVFFKCHKNEEWITYNVWNNEFPTHNQLLSLNGITITASRCDAFDNNTKWIIDLRKLIHKIVYDPIYQHVKVIGLCFGHQIIAESLRNGKVDVNPLKNAPLIHDNWEIGLRQMVLNKSFYKTFPYFSRNRNTLRVLMHHRDAVISLPENAILLASSKWTKYEMFVIGNKVLSFQGHPELSIEFVKEIAQKQMNKKSISFDTYNHAVSTMKQHRHNHIWSGLFSEWLRR